MVSNSLPVTLFTVTDNHYSVLLAALLKSLELHHRSGELIHFYIVSDCVTSRNKQKLEKCIESDRIKLFWIEMNDILKRKHSLPQDNSSFPLIVYVRLLFPSFLPPGTERAIYLDVDMILKKDISVLWNTCLENKVVAGVPDRAARVSSPWGGIKNYKELGIEADTIYYNSGLLLIDCRKWIESQCTEKILRCISENRKFANFPDQYGLNVVFANQWKQLESAWNKYAFEKCDDPFIIHFIGTKPIYTSYRYLNEYKDEFYSCLKMTPWADFRPHGRMILLLRKVRNKMIKKINRTLNRLRPLSHQTQCI